MPSAATCIAAGESCESCWSKSEEFGATTCRPREFRFDACIESNAAQQCQQAAAMGCNGSCTCQDKRCLGHHSAKIKLL